MDNNETIEQIEAKFKEICTDLDVDQKISDIAWRGYDAVRKQCALEGSQIPWLSCSIFVASWLCPPQNLTDPDKKKTTALMILDHCGLSIIDFFERLQKWVAMANMSKRYLDQVIIMESNFAVTSVVFKKFDPIFHAMFTLNESIDETSKIKLKDKTKTKMKKPEIVKTPYSHLTLENLKTFCWTLFIFLKRNFLTFQDDLIKCYHVLLCCIDLVWSNCKDLNCPLMNKAFADSLEQSDENALIEHLCVKYDGVVLDAKQMRIHWFINKVQNLIIDEVMKGDENKLLGLISGNNFERNLASLDDNYRKIVECKAEIDERIFLRCDKSRLLCPDENSLSSEDKEAILRRNVEACLDKVNQYSVPTPLTGRRYLDSEYFCPISPLSTLQSASKLQSLLVNGSLSPSESLKNILNSYGPNPMLIIKKVLSDVGESFLAASCHETQNIGDENLPDFARQKRDMSEMLYFRILEKILRTEQEKAAPNELTKVINHEVFHKALIGCCYELVLFSFNSTRTFPWILQIVNLHAFHFYKIIELVIRPEPELTREMVKHLNHVEERILEELAFINDSPLWVALATQSVPTCEEVALPAPITKIINLPSALSGALRQNIGTGSPLTNLATSAALNKPVTPGQAKRRLDFDTSERSPVPLKISGVAVRPSVPITTSSDMPRPENMLPMPAGISVTSGSKIRLQVLNTTSTTISATGTTTSTNTATIFAPNGQTIRLMGSENVAPALKIIAKPATPQIGSSKLQGGSLALFFRKLYYLTSLRLHDLCERCRVNETVEQNAWTLFHHVLTENVTLLKNRHVDQMLMCSLYVISKVMKFDLSFHEIMSNYRQQPQAKSRVYRNVLLGSKSTTPTTENEAAPGSQPTSEDSNSSSSNSNSISSSSVASKPRTTTATPPSDKDTTSAAPSSGALTPVSVKLRSGSTMPVPTLGSAPPTPTPFEEERGDLIKFYNTIFVLKLEEFAKKFQQPQATPDQRNLPHSVPQSPLPVIRSLHYGISATASPRRRILDSIYVSPMKRGDFQAANQASHHNNNNGGYSHHGSTPSKRPYRYSFSRSPAKDLRIINDMLQRADPTRGTGITITNVYNR